MLELEKDSGHHATSRSGASLRFYRGRHTLRRFATPGLGADSVDRIRIMLETCMNEVRKHEDDIHKLFATLSALESHQRTDAAKDLLVDATRKAINTRAIERVKRIGLILANGTIEPNPTHGDEIEEMMRVAMELSGNDIRYLRELL